MHMRDTILNLSVLLVAAMAVSCSSKYDDTALWDRLGGLEERASLLEDRCNRINTNVAALQGLVRISLSSDRITSVTPIVEDGVTTGYTFTFCFSAPVTVWCGTDGKDGQDGADGQDGKDGTDGADGAVPTIGVSEVDGVMYWTLNGEFLLDGNGERIPLVTSGGTVTDGVTPMLKVENGLWYCSLDNGVSWTEMPVTVQYGDGNVFKAVQDGDSEVTFTLADGSALSIAKVGTLSISLSQSAQQSISRGSSIRLDWTLTSGGLDVEVDAFAEGDWTVSVQREDKALQGSLTISAPSDATGTSTVVLFVTDSNGLSDYVTIKCTAI